MWALWPCNLKKLEIVDYNSLWWILAAKYLKHDCLKMLSNWDIVLHICLFWCESRWFYLTYYTKMLYSNLLILLNYVKSRFSGCDRSKKKICPEISLQEGNEKFKKRYSAHILLRMLKIVILWDDPFKINVNVKAVNGQYL